MNTMKKFISLLFIIIFAMACNEDNFFDLKRPNEFPWGNVNEFEVGVREP